MCLDIISADGEKCFHLKNVKTISRTLPCQSVRQKVVEKYSQLKGIRGLSYCRGQPTILIGLDNANITLTTKIVKGGPNGPFAAKTGLGWVLAGRIGESGAKDYSFLVNDQGEELNQMVKHYFSTESFGVNVSKQVPRSKEDSRALEVLEATSHRVDDR